MTVSITFELNGEQRQCEVEPRRLAAHHLREAHHQYGVRIGCDTAQCGACTVLLDGVLAKSCNLLAVQLHERSVTTIEGVPGGDKTPGTHVMQQAFHEHHGLQCGFCTPGMVMTALAIADSDQELTDANIRHCLVGNLCRCTGYEFIVDSIRDGATRIRAER